MIIYCGIMMLMFLQSVRTTEYNNYYNDYGMGDSATQINKQFWYWPALGEFTRMQKRAAEQAKGASEGGIVNDLPQKAEHVAPELEVPAPPTSVSSGFPSVTSPSPPLTISHKSNDVPKDSKKNEIPEIPKGNGTAINAKNLTTLETSTNSTATEQASPTKLDPGVMMRGVIVFGGFLLLALAYYLFYRKKASKNETSNIHSPGDAVQFRYGVLHSEDKRGNLELSNVPLTMESDEDEDDDLEIFDLEQKKKSLSYVNLQTNDEDVVFEHPKDKDDKEGILLDIEDPATDTLINWTNNGGSKSIL